jgi:formylmethanofuran dehydrogenase subunit E
MNAPYGKLAVTVIERSSNRAIRVIVPCTACGELSARAYLRVVGEKAVCIPCSGYDR